MDAVLQIEQLKEKGHKNLENMKIVFDSYQLYIRDRVDSVLTDNLLNRDLSLNGEKTEEEVEISMSTTPDDLGDKNAVNIEYDEEKLIAAASLFDMLEKDIKLKVSFYSLPTFA